MHNATFMISSLARDKCIDENEVLNCVDTLLMRKLTCARIYLEEHYRPGNPFPVELARDMRRILHPCTKSVMIRFASLAEWW